MTLQLRPYQEEAVEHLIQRRLLLLAMVMGSGKTATTIAALRRLRRERQVYSGAVFVPNSIKWQWTRELERWDPRARFQVVDGPARRRRAQIRRSRNYQYTILHYQTLVNDWPTIKEYLALDFLIFDEVTALKSFNSKTSKRAKLLARRTPIRVGLSGQPVENRPEELYSIYEAIDPEVLGPFPKFDRTFIVRDHWGRPQRYRNLHLLRARLGDAMFRRSRDDIKEWLPEKVEITVPVVLDTTTMNLHDLVRGDLREAIDKAIAMGVAGGFDLIAHYGRAPDSDRKMLMGQVMSRLLAMRMLSSHPRLLRCSADDFDNPLSRKGSEYASELKSAGLLDNLPLANAKLDALIDTITEVLAEDPTFKVVVFSYFKPMVAMIGTELTKLKIPYTTITGDVPTQQRDERIVRFNTDPKCRVFLSSDAGAYGIDLFAGSHLISYDLPWSAGAMAQRIARIDRTSSGFEQIMVTHMFGQGTIEERMFDMLQQKLKVARAFIDGDFDARTGTLNLDLQSLREFLG